MGLKKLFAAAAALTLILLTGCSRSEYRSVQGMTWNTLYNIVYESDSDLQDSVTAAMKRVEMSLSPFEKRSVISKINRSESDSVDALVELVFAESQRINRLSGGMFDPTVAPIINLWGFGYENPDSLPTEAAIDSCLSLVGIAECRIAGNLMVKKHPGTQFNFSAITKGFGCDEVGRALASAGSENYMVEIGGEIRMRGLNPRGGKWRIQIDAPVQDPVADVRMAVIEVTDCGVATSGNYRNYRDTEKGRIAHTISPVTGLPVVPEMLSATVIAPETMTADALATACMAMPLDDAIRMIEQLGEGYAALFVTGGDEDNNQWKLVSTTRFPQIM